MCDTTELYHLSGQIVYAHLSVGSLVGQIRGVLKADQATKTFRISLSHSYDNDSAMQFPAEYVQYIGPYGKSGCRLILISDLVPTKV